MTKAQEVRSRRVEAKQKNLNEHAEKIFDWILDLIDAGTKKKYFRKVEVGLIKDKNIIMTTDTDLSGEVRREYDLRYNLPSVERIELFKKLKAIVDKEEGFKSTLIPNALFCEEEAIIFQVDVE